ncbi:MAG: hypothetical protein ACHQ4H_09440 [Ktedonobacterales bacterium]
MIGFVEPVMIVAGLVGSVAGGAVLVRSLMLYQMEPLVQYLPEPTCELRVPGGVAAALSTLGELLGDVLGGLLPERRA